MAWFKLRIPSFLLFGKAELIAVQYRQGIAASTGGELRLVLWPWNRIRGIWLLLMCHV